MTSWGVTNVHVNHTAIHTVCNACAFKQDEEERRRKERARREAIFWAVFIGTIAIVIASFCLLPSLFAALSHLGQSPAQSDEVRLPSEPPVVAPTRGRPDPELTKNPAPKEEKPDPEAERKAARVRELENQLGDIRRRLVGARDYQERLQKEDKRMTKVWNGLLYADDRAALQKRFILLRKAQKEIKAKIDELVRDETRAKDELEEIRRP